MKFRVRLFARARDLAGADHVAVELPAGATVADLRRRLVALLPALADLAGKVRGGRGRRVCRRRRAC